MDIEKLRKILKKCTNNTLWGHSNRFKILILYETDLCDIIELFKKQNSEINKKDKIIELMAEYIEKVTVDMKIAFGENMLWDRNQIKQDFERKVEDERN